MIKLEQRENSIYTKGGRRIAVVKDGKVYVNTYEYGRLVRPLRTLLGESIHFVLL